MYIGLENIRIYPTGNKYLGGAVKIQVIYDTVPDSVNITIEDSVGVDKVDQVAMTQVSGANKVWEYTYQSNESDYDGIYGIYIRATKDSNVSFYADTFEIVDIDDD